jgi:dihydroorotate dehydrogenase (fumarate)
MDLATSYLGKLLRSPLVVSANPLSESLDNIKRMEDAGAGAIVLYSLFEERLRTEQHGLQDSTKRVAGSSSTGAGEFGTESSDLLAVADTYLNHVRKAKEVVKIPIIASLNGSTGTGWSHFARQIEQAGADALELNLYAIEANPTVSAHNIEASYTGIAHTAKAVVKIPVAVKLSPFFTNMAYTAHQFDEARIDGLVLFNRFYQPDIDLETRTVYPHVLLSTSQDLRLPLRWIGILYQRIDAQLAASGGIHHGDDVVKVIMAGANVAMMTSALLLNGIDHLRVVEQQVRDWMEKHEFNSIDEMRGVLSQVRVDNPSEFERAQYIRALTTYLPKS